MWRMTLKNNRAPLLSNIKLYASFHNHTWIQTGVTVRKRLSWVLTSVTLTFDLWPWPFAWTSLLSLVITPENFVMIRWWEHSQKGVTYRQTDGRTKRSVLRAAWSQLKISAVAIVPKSPNSFQYHWINYVHADKRGSERARLCTLRQVHIYAHTNRTASNKHIHWYKDTEIRYAHEFVWSTILLQTMLLDLPKLSVIIRVSRYFIRVRRTNWERSSVYECVCWSLKAGVNKSRCFTTETQGTHTVTYLRMSIIYIYWCLVLINLPWTKWRQNNRR